jgi:hypothetical protein
VVKLRRRVGANLEGSEDRVWLIMLLGVVMTGFGIAYATASAPDTGRSADVANNIISGLLTAVGGGIVGASVSILVTGGSDRDTLQKLRGVVQDSLMSKLTSDEASLGPVRQLWHHYYVTATDGKHVWRYRQFHFELSVAVSSAVTGMAVKDQSGRTRLYRVEAGIRGDRLIIVSAMVNGQEPPLIEIYPQFVNYKDLHYGVALLQNWDGYNMLSRTILSNHDLLGGAVPEGMIPAEYFEDLDTKWERGFADHNELLPSARPKSGTSSTATP